MRTERTPPAADLDPPDLRDWNDPLARAHWFFLFAAAFCFSVWGIAMPIALLWMVSRVSG